MILIHYRKYAPVTAITSWNDFSQLITVILLFTTYYYGYILFSTSTEQNLKHSSPNISKEHSNKICLPYVPSSEHCVRDRSNP